MTVIINACTSPPEGDPNSFCDKSQLYMCSCGQRHPAPVQPWPALPQSENLQQQQQLITVANPPDLTRAETVDLSAWAKQAVLGGDVNGGLPEAKVAASPSWTQDIAESATGGSGDDIWTGEGNDAFI